MIALDSTIKLWYYLISAEYCTIMHVVKRDISVHERVAVGRTANR